MLSPCSPNSSCLILIRSRRRCTIACFCFLLSCWRPLVLIILLPNVCHPLTRSDSTRSKNLAYSWASPPRIKPPLLPPWLRQRPVTLQSCLPSVRRGRRKFRSRFFSFSFLFLSFSSPPSLMHPRLARLQSCRHCFILFFFFTFALCFCYFLLMFHFF